MLIVTGERSANADALTRDLLNHLRRGEVDLGLQKASLFFDFPLYREENRLVQCRFLMVSPNHGVVLAGVTTSGRDSGKRIKLADEELDLAFGQVMARFIKNPDLRQSKRGLAFELDAFLFAPELPQFAATPETNFTIVRNAAELKEILNGLRRDPLSDELVQEILATIEGAKGLLRPKEREVPDDENSKAAHVIQLEEEINRFDRDQTEGYLVRTTGVQRIRGLAGSGKTVVLAIKAALLHLQNPDAKIAFTFHTKSLYQHVRRLITRFYRQYDDRDPDWDRLHVLHGWGGKSNQGIYYNACINNGARPLTFSEANAMGGRSALDSACSSLLAELTPRPEYDYVLVDEAQDFPPSFLRLCYALARNGNLVYAYDQLQTIFQVKPPSVDEVFGLNEQGEPNVQLASDVVLHRCYRNPLEVTVCAHALGFGIYGDRIVQMLENEDHWRDLGYRVLNPPFKAGALTEIERVQDSSPSSISRNYRSDEIVSVAVYADATEEIAAVVKQIDKAIRNQGLRPDDVLVISCDDRFAKMYLSAISTQLQKKGIGTNNLHVDTYSLQDFVRDNSVTLSTIHKAKGNEAYQVFLVGVDALFQPVTVRRRNMMFTAMTRAKAWLSISGVGQFAQVCQRELELALRNAPKLQFRYPSKKDLQIMQRDLRESPEQRAEAIIRELQTLMPDADISRLLAQKSFDFGAKSKPKRSSSSKPRDRK